MKKFVVSTSIFTKQGGVKQIFFDVESTDRETALRDVHSLMYREHGELYNLTKDMTKIVEEELD